MTLSRRRVLHAVAGGIVPISFTIARAESYPSRPIRFVVPFPPGGVSDVIGRQMGQ